MPKSKDQKRREAQERKIKGLAADRAYYLDAQPGGNSYKAHLHNGGKKFADEMAAETEKWFDRQCREAGCDRQGNPLDLVPVWTGKHTVLMEK